MFTIACPISGSSRQTGEEEQRASRLAAEEEEVKMVTDRQAGWMTGADDGDLVVDVDGWWKDSHREQYESLSRPFLLDGMKAVEA
ncbi:hypothetical protein HL42_2133 [Trichophyton rubrum]|nr:hypothetical protein HL42_2133 [Trichophyton rubrum]